MVKGAAQTCHDTGSCARAGSKLRIKIVVDLPLDEADASLIVGRLFTVSYNLATRTKNTGSLHGASPPEPFIQLHKISQFGRVDSGTATQLPGCAASLLASLSTTFSTLLVESDGLLNSACESLPSLIDAKPPELKLLCLYLSMLLCCRPAKPRCGWSLEH